MPGDWGLSEESGLRPGLGELAGSIQEAGQERGGGWEWGTAWGGQVAGRKVQAVQGNGLFGVRTWVQIPPSISGAEIWHRCFLVPEPVLIL